MQKYLVFSEFADYEGVFLVLKNLVEANNVLLNWGEVGFFQHLDN